MPIVVVDVRIALNNISEQELSSLTIQQKIDDATQLADEQGLASGYKRDQFIRDHAAWRSFLVSKVYSSVKIGDLTVSKDVEALADELRMRAETSLQTATSSGLTVVKSTPMFDDRPKDPNDPGDLGGLP